MTRASVLLATLALLATPAVAQTHADKARLDEFAVPASDAAIDLEQLDPDAPATVPAAPATRDRGLTVAPLQVPARAPIAQLSEAGDAPTTTQLSGAAESREVAARSVSSPGDSRPRATPPLGGQDRCAVGSKAEPSAECARILERRAAEFHAAEPPRMSAEQVLLAESWPSLDQARTRIGQSGTPDADAPGNQELAALYLYATRDRQEPPPAAPPADDATMAKVLEALQIETVAPTAP